MIEKANPFCKLKIFWLTRYSDYAKPVQTELLAILKLFVCMILEKLLSMWEIISVLDNSGNLAF